MQSWNTPQDLGLSSVPQLRPPESFGSRRLHGSLAPRSYIDVVGEPCRAAYAVRRIIYRVSFRAQLSPQFCSSAHDHISTDPDGLESGIIEMEYHDVFLHILFAQVIVDAKFVFRRTGLDAQDNSIAKAFQRNSEDTYRPRHLGSSLALARLYSRNQLALVGFAEAPNSTITHHPAACLICSCSSCRFTGAAVAVLARSSQGNSDCVSRNIVGYRKLVSLIGVFTVSGLQCCAKRSCLDFRDFVVTDRDQLIFGKATHHQPSSSSAPLSGIIPNSLCSSTFCEGME